jgi:hypothetical protein
VSLILPAFRSRIPRWLDHFFVGPAGRKLSLLFGMIAARPGIIFCIAHIKSSHCPASAAVFEEKSYKDPRPKPAPNTRVFDALRRHLRNRAGVVAILGVRSKAHRRSKRLARGSFGMALQDGAMTKRGCQAKKTAIGATIAATGGKTSPLLKCWAIVAKPRSTRPGTDMTMTATDTLKHHIKTG